MWKLTSILLILVLITTTGLTIGCGGEEKPSPEVVPQSEYDQVLAERDMAKERVAKLQADLKSTRERVSNLESKNSELESKLSAANEGITTLRSRLEEGPVKSVLPTISVRDDEGWTVDIRSDELLPLHQETHQAC